MNVIVYVLVTSKKAKTGSLHDFIYATNQSTTINPDSQLNIDLCLHSKIP